MAKISVNVPKDKMQSFLQAVRNLGIDAGDILKKRYDKSVLQKKKISQSLKNLFGWEYFSNELEFE